MNVTHDLPPEALDKYRGALDDALKSMVPAEPKGLYDLLRYHLGWMDAGGGYVGGGSAGKALRPTLCFLTCEALGCPWPKAAKAAATVELVHNFSLIHDDIQDGDTERRGRPTVWSVWGVGPALWAGNAMRVLSDQALATDPALFMKRRQAARLLTQAYLDIIEGQYQDLEFESRTDISVAEYLSMISRKTGALICCAVEMGGLLVTEDQGAVAALRQWSVHLGRAFQVRDDILGVWGNPVLTGKAVGNDIRRKKKTLPVLYGFQRAAGYAGEILKTVYQSAAVEEQQVQEVLAILEETQAYEESQALVNTETAKAIDVLERVEGRLSPWALQQMVQLTYYLAQRDK